MLSLAGTSAQAAEPPASPSPESVVQSYVQALQSGQYQAVAELMHPEALEKFQSMMLPLFDVAGAEETASLLAFFRDVPDVAAIKKLSRTEFFAAFFAGILGGPEMKEVLASVKMTPIGSVPEGDVLHFVCRSAAAAEGVSISKLEVVSLKRSAGNWRVLLSGEMEGVAQALRNAMSDKT